MSKKEINKEDLANVVGGYRTPRIKDGEHDIVKNNLTLKDRSNS